MNKRLGFATKEEKLSYWMMVVSSICMLVNLYAVPHKINRLIALSNRAMLLLWILLAGFLVVKRFFRKTPKRYSWFFVIIVFSLFAVALAAVGRANTVVANITALCAFFALPVMLMYGLNYTIPAKVKPVVLIANIGASMIFILLYFSGLRHAFDTYYGVRYIGSVTLGYPNPNQTAMYLFVCAVNLFAALFYFKKKTLRILIGADLLLMLYMLNKTDSRTAILMVVLVAFLCVILWKRKLSQVWVNIALLAPLIYAILAQYLFPYFDEIMILGESLFNGREDIYDRYFNNLSLSTFLFGDFNRFRFQNLHNGYVAIAATIGIVGLVSFVSLLKNALAGIGDVRLKEYEKIAAIAFLCIIVYTCTEAAFFVGSVNYAYLMYTVFLLFAIPDNAEEPAQNEVR